MSTFHHPAAKFHGVAEDVVSTNVFQADCSGNNVDNGIRGANFVKVYFFDIHVVNYCLGGGNVREDIQRALRHGVRVACVIDYPTDVRQVPVVMWLVVELDGGASAADAQFRAGCDFEVELAGHAQPGEFSFEVFNRDSEIEHCADVHVTRNAAETVVDENFVWHRGIVPVFMPAFDVWGRTAG
jgi:hypothetical protein